MSMAMGALLAAATGGATGWIDAWAIRGRRESPVLYIALASLIAALAYGAFLAAGLLVSLILFSGPPSPVPALLCTGLGCVTYLGVSWLRVAIAPRKASPMGKAALMGHRPLPAADWTAAPGSPAAWALESLTPVAAPRSRTPWASLDSPAAVTGPVRWIVGLGLAGLFVYYGLQCLWTRSGEMGSLPWRMTVAGGPAIALGLGFVGIGVFLHLHFFYRDEPTWDDLRRNGKLVALIAAFVGHAVALCWGLLRQSMS